MFILYSKLDSYKNAYFMTEKTKLNIMSTSFATVVIKLYCILKYFIWHFSNFPNRVKTKFWVYYVSIKHLDFWFCPQPASETIWRQSFRNSREIFGVLPPNLFFRGTEKILFLKFRKSIQLHCVHKH